MKGATYNQLNIFHAIVQQSSISAAARKLEIAPPSVSQALKTLEHNIGLSLFIRSTRRLELTEAGTLLYEHTLPAMQSLGYALDSVRELSEKPRGTVRLTLPRFVWQLWLAPVYQAFCHRYPEVVLEVSISDAAIDIVEQGIDIGIRFGDKVEQGMVARQMTPPMNDALFASPEYLERFGVPQTPEDLKRHRLIQYRFIASNRLAVLQLGKPGDEVTVDMPTAMIVNDTDMMIDAAIKGLGIGKLVEPVASDAMDKGLLQPVLKDYWRKSAGLYVYFPQGSQKIRRNRVLIDFLLETAAEINQPPI